MRVRKDWRAKLAELVERAGKRKRTSISVRAGFSPSYLRDVLDRNQDIGSASKAQALSDAMGVEITDWYLDAKAEAQRPSGIDHREGEAHVIIRGTVK